MDPVAETDSPMVQDAQSRTSRPPTWRLVVVFHINSVLKEKHRDFRVRVLIRSRAQRGAGTGQPRAHSSWLVVEGLGDYV